MQVIQIQDIVKSYQKDQLVIDHLSLDVEKGEFVVLLGASGCGKTTLLKMINKLLTFESGQIIVNGRNIQEWDTIELRRSIGYVIQHIGLLPHLTIENNITYVLSLMKVAKGTRRKRAEELIDLLGFERSFLTRYPRELSGGQRQRIGVARALAADPDIILMDEPFGAVDEIARGTLQDELKSLHAKLGKTVIFVTHDIAEALKLGTRIILLNNGKIEQQGTGRELIFNPKTPFVKEFFGLKGFRSILDGSLMEQVYENILCGSMTLNEVYNNLRVENSCEE
ncbi:ATP-binding cassette domain-containing protein [Clostridia bacterium]|nr:ATP-binding cassette domain-containing protein [Clostridia bacterium]